MYIIAIGLFIVAAIFGSFILAAILRNQPTPKPAVFSHGPIALAALVIMIIYAASGHTNPLLITSIVLFIIAALGGLTMFAIDMQNKPVPKAMALLHPLLAIIALITLIISVMH